MVVGWVVDTPKRRQCNEGACGEDYKLPTYTQRVAELFYDASYRERRRSMRTPFVRESELINCIAMRITNFTLG